MAGTEIELKKEKHPFALEKAEESTGFLLWQVMTLWQQKVAKALQRHELTQVQFALLASLLWLQNHEEHVTQIMLAKHTRLDKMMTSQVLRHLEKRELLVRRQHPEDSRAKSLHLTAIGQKLACAAIPDVEGTDAKFFGKLETQKGPFNDLLRMLNEDRSSQ